MSTALQYSALPHHTRKEPKSWSLFADSQRKPVASVIVLNSTIEPSSEPAPQPAAKPVVCYAFYRKHTESMLRRYLYASMQVGRSPNILGESIDRGWCSSRKVRTFEDAVIFVLDIETCINKLSPFDRRLLARIVLQEYSQTETASLMGLSTRTVHTKYPEAVDRLTVLLVNSQLLTLP